MLTTIHSRCKLQLLCIFKSHFLQFKTTHSMNEDSFVSYALYPLRMRCGI